MLDFKIKNYCIGLSFSFFALLAVLFYYSEKNSESGILIALLSCLIHETGHILLMSIFGAAPEKIIFYAGGIKIIPNCRLLHPVQERLILLAGSGFNLTAAAAASLAGLEKAAAINLVIGLFNLLPFKTFDGGRIFENLSFEKSELFEILRRSVSLIIISAGIFLLIFCGVNLSLAVTVCYIIASEIFC